MLSREAIVTLRAPRHISPPPPTFSPSTLGFLAVQWTVLQSTGPLQRVTTRDGTPLAPESDDAAAAKTMLSLSASTNLSTPATMAALQHSPSPSNSTEIEILAWGKEGQLADWMVDEGDGWIGDGSGERRADWRDSYVVAYVHGSGSSSAGGEKSEKNEGQTPAIEIWNRFGPERPLQDATLAQIRAALDAVPDDGFRALAAALIYTGGVMVLGALSRDVFVRFKLDR
ncbi:hypothetical protein B0T26DRAFT_669519 [Lasiosphaeria miniovina]|uniref:Uncharacterized protein n=1 Tax=Lasiosphaeria miniovina TaxID=1954250 RepID=A0AA40BF15_9PEZI|nr:uncharacterized protein B0T26DRAFT_669519 [Lasiosphaeria miniovina]KAK0733066.1 hypothetical protein B0T26DRAFT_669519 [Lasiosphaeria miniovina]